MRTILRHRAARVGASVAITFAVAAAAAVPASAYSIDSISGGPGYTGTSLTAQSFKKGAAGYTMNCAIATATGATQNVPGDPASTDLLIAYRGGSRNYGTGAYDACVAGALSPSSVATTGNWRLTVAGPPTAGSYPLTLSILPGSTMVWTQQAGGGPLLNACTTTFDSVGNTGLTGLRGTPTATGLRISGAVSGMRYTVAGTICLQGPKGTFSDVAYTTGGTTVSGGIELAGVTINP